MKRNRVVSLMLMLVAGFICGPAAAQSLLPSKGSASEGTRLQRPRLADDYGRLPLSFEANTGQTDYRVEFLSRSSSQTLFLTSHEAVLVLSKPLDRKPDLSDFAKLSPPRSTQSAALRMRLLGANSLANVTGLESLPGTSNYFIGNDPTRWRTNVPTYGKVRYSQIYPGVDLLYYGNQRELEYDFVVAPGADPAQIRLAIQGAEKISIDAAGDAVLHRKDGDVRLQRPRLYQEVRGEKIEIAGEYTLKGNELRFAIAPYDHSQRLVIDPVLVYSTYLGGSGGDSPTGIAVDSSGNAYVSGQTNSLNFPGAPGNGKFQNFVVKLNAAGNAVLYSTYISGSGTELATAIAIDSAGSAYVTGRTNSTDFPTRNPLQSANAGGYDAFVAKLDATGSLVYSTYLGGSKDDAANAIALDSSGNIYLAGQTNSTNFPGVTSSSPQRSLAGNFSNAFVTKVNAAGSSLIYSTYLGGNGGDYAKGIAVDSSGNAYVVGTTASSNFPVTSNPIQSTFGGGSNDAFVSMLNAAGTALVYSTYLGGNDNDFGNAIAVDSSGNAYVTGYTASTNFPGVTSSSIQPVNGGNYTGIVAKLNASGTALVYSTYLGGNALDVGNGIAVDSSGNAYVTGTTRSTNFVGVTAASIQPVNGGGADAFVSELNAGGTGLVFSTYLGGSGNDSGNGVALDSTGNIYVTGDTASTNFPVTANPLQSTYGGNNDAFIAKLSAASTGAATTTTLTSSASSSVFGQQLSFTATVSPTSSSSLTPTGNVTINDGSTVLGTVALNAGTAIFNTSALPAGSHSITTSYAGDSNFASSMSTARSQTVNQGTTTTTVAAASDRVCNPSSGICAVGQSVTLTATVTPVAPASGTPTGTVNFLDGSTSLGSGTLSGGQATFTTSSLTSGMHSITTVYAGDTNFLTSTSSILSLAVQQTTTATLTSSPNPSNTGQSVSMTATIIPGASSTSTPTGAVTFLDGTTALGTGTLNPLSCKLCTSATATLSTSSLTAGTHSLTASYGGDTNFASSTSSAVTQTVILLITVNESIHVTDVSAVVPSVMIGLNESIKVLDQPSIPVYVTPTVTPIPAGVLTNAQRNAIEDLHVSGDLACYVSGVFSAADATAQVRFYDLVTQTDAIVPGWSSQAGDQMCDVKSSTIVVQRGGILFDFNSDRTSSILTFDAANPSVAPVQIASNAGEQNMAPRIGDQTIIWQSRPYPKGTASSIVTYDRVSATTQTISPRFFPDGQALMSSQSPAISPDGLVAIWEGCTDSSTPSCLTWQALLSSGTWTAQQLGSAVQGNQSHPGTDGSIIVYSSAVLPDQSQHLLVWQPVGGGTEQVLNLPGQFANPSVSSGLIAFSYAAPGNAYHDIALYDTVYDRFYNLTADLRPGDTFDKLLSDISVTADGKVRVVWQGSVLDANGHPNGTVFMFAYTFQRVNTPAGPNVVVNPSDTTTGTTPVGVTFTNVTQAGITSLTTSSTGAPPPPGFQPGTPLVYYDISTSAAYTGPVNICINFTGVVFPGSAPPHFFHFENGAWVDHTLSVNVTNMIVCGSVASLSPFAVFQPAVIAATTSISAPGVTYGTPASVMVSASSSVGTVGGSVTLSVDGGAASTMALSNGSTVFNLGVLNAGGHSLSASFAAQGSFSASATAGTLSVTPAPLTIAANSTARPYGANNPALTGSVIGLQNGDAISASFTSLATPASPVGVYPITPVVFDPANRLGNYTLSPVNGTLSVMQEPTFLTVALSPTSIVVGQSTTLTLTLTAPDMVIPMNPGVLASLTVNSPIVSDILTNNGICTPLPSTAPGTASCSLTLTAIEPNGRTLTAGFPGSSALGPSTGSASLIVTAPLESKVSCIKSDFRNVAVSGGSYLWLNSIFKIRDLNKQKVNITFFQSSVQFQYRDANNNLVTVNQALPDAKITIDPSVSTASTLYDAVDNVWITTVPFDTDDATFLTGIPLLVPAGGIPADIEPVTWCGTFASDTAGVDIGWRWSAAAYSSFSGDNNMLGIKPMNTDHDNPPANRDNAGTPEIFKGSVIPGARGKGGKNYTGSYSGSAEIE